MNPDQPHFSEPEPEITATPRPRAARSKKRRSGWLIGAIALVVIGYMGFAPRVSQRQKLESDVAAASHQDPLVSTVTLQTSPGVSEISLPSNLQAIATTTINARTNGYVRARYVDIGSKVSAGQVLADIESPEMDQQVLQSQAEVAKSQAGVGQARADVSRLRATLTEAESEIIRYQANLDQSKADLAHLRARLLGASSAVAVAEARYTQAEKKLDGMRAELARAKVGEDIAKKTLDRWQELEKADAVSGQDVDEKQSDYDSSQARVEAARAEVNSSEADVLAAKQFVKSQEAEVGAAKADIQSGQQRIQAAQAAVRSARANATAGQAAISASQSNVAASQATVGSTEANVRRYEAMQSFEHVTAPFAGVITARNVDVGDLVNAASGGSGASDQTNTVTKSGLFGLAATDELLAQAHVPEDSVASIRTGQDADVIVSEYSGRVFRGKVQFVSGALDASSRTLLVEVKIPNHDSALKPGMYAQIHFLGARSQPVLRIPATGLIFDASGNRVAVITAQGTLHFVPVKLGRDFGGQIEVLEGLSGGETIVTNPDDSLTEGEKVRVAPTSK